jgi:hypothetical protein
MTNRQQKLINLLLTAKSARSACQRAGVAERTYRRWAATSAFREALAAARQAAFGDAIGLLQGLMRPAIRTLRRCLHSRRDADALKAAVAAIDRAIKGVELVDILQRLEELERRHHGPPS